MARSNEYDQPIGAALSDWSARAQPAAVTLSGRYSRLEPLNAERHAAELYEAYASASDGRDWTYLPVGPHQSAADYKTYAQAAEKSTDPRHYAVIDQASGKAVGTLALMRIDPTHGVIEVGHVTFSPKLKQSALSTEAQYLLMAYAFDELGYRRYEWKCDDLNAPSRRAADRLGFTYEGTFRQALVYKGRSRDTAWYAIIDSEWPALKAAFVAWLDPANFDEQDRQRQALSAFRAG
ncbi:GNAT family protein [Pseudomonas sp. RP23018S]|uniref:GNAT family N-acetyltransferase n=1 Tax=Pseudomonas sp. RP23018S TaxID=3096037 RepID=UPI002ACAEDD7|nr:GNAT family protein [Pseudomonas sp. RP23018S]MDZ5601533.1 GNAT family protein [Pseudomonas sp. RP23018S]